MNWLDFWASIFASLTSLAWPAAIVVCVWLFRREIRPLLPRLRLRHKETEVSFRLDEAEKTVENLPPPALPAPETPEENVRFAQIAQLSPNAAITELRREIETEVRSLARFAGVPAYERQSLRQLIRILRSHEAISTEASSLLDDLLTVGNMAAHSNKEVFTADDALRYRRYADRLVELLNEARIQEVLRSG